MMKRTAATAAIDEAIGARVRARRLELNMSQMELAAALDLTFQQVQKYEKGTNRIGGSRLTQIAAILKTGPAAFFAPDDDDKPAMAMLDMASTHVGSRMIAAFNAITDHEMRKTLCELAEAAAR